jgi:GH24 family phage-related lysozyme (muramidase)
VVSYGKRISSVMAELDFAKYGSIVTDIKQQQTKMLDFSKFGSIVTAPFRKETLSFEDALVNRLIDLEGFIGTAKKATKGEEFFTIGYGHYGSDVNQDQTITKEEAKTLLTQDINKRLPAIRKAIPSFDSFSTELKVELAQSWYRGGLSGSPKTISLINKGDFTAASTEFLDNREYKNAAARGRAGIRPRMEAVSNALLEAGKS